MCPARILSSRDLLFGRDFTGFFEVHGFHDIIGVVFKKNRNLDDVIGIMAASGAKCRPGLRPSFTWGRIFANCSLERTIPHSLEKVFTISPGEWDLWFAMVFSRARLFKHKLEFIFEAFHQNRREKAKEILRNIIFY